jgi:dihydrofolate reductase/thymidylate synthase
MISLFVTLDKNNGISKNGIIPWNIKKNTEYLTNKIKETLNQKNILIMDENTWKHIEKSYMINSILLVLTSSNNLLKTNQKMFFKSVDDVLLYIKYYKNEIENVKNIFFIGGKIIYEDIIERGICENIYVTEVDKDFECDLFFDIDNYLNNQQFFKTNYTIENISEIYYSEKEKCNFQFIEYKNKNNILNFFKYSKEDEKYFSFFNKLKKEKESLNTIKKIKNIKYLANSNVEEQQYLNIVKNILENGLKRNDRTNTGTLSIFGCQMRFSLQNNQNNILPLLTTKKVFVRGVIEELLWFLRGNTNIKLLQNKKVNIWNGNSSREFLDSIGLYNNEVGDPGPIYGFNFRHFGAEYKDCHTDYTNQGIDQLVDVIDKLKNDPTSRRIIINLWNPLQLKEVALPACHTLYQFYVDVEKKYLSCSLYQRSGDMGLGIPFNIASCSILTHILAKCCDLIPYEIIHTIGDAHVYLDHIDALKEQLKKEPTQFPTLEITKDINNVVDIENLNYNDFIVSGYNPVKGGVAMKMAV